MKNKTQNKSKILSISLICLMLCLFASVFGTASVNAAPIQSSTEPCANQVNTVVNSHMYPRFLDTITSAINNIIKGYFGSINRMIEIDPFGMAFRTEQKAMSPPNTFPYW
jgi:Na+-transporting NADH:ubiquinone oxidoreductase subunit NqrC